MTDPPDARVTRAKSQRDAHEAALGAVEGLRASAALQGAPPMDMSSAFTQSPLDCTPDPLTAPKARPARSHAHPTPGRRHPRHHR